MVVYFLHLVVVVQVDCLVEPSLLLRTKRIPLLWVVEGL